MHGLISLDLVLFVASTFAAAVVTGIGGFPFSNVAVAEPKERSRFQRPMMADHKPYRITVLWHGNRDARRDARAQNDRCRRTFEKLRAISIAAVLAWLFAGSAAGAVELKVQAGGAMRAALQELAPAFEKASGHKVVIEYGTVVKVDEKVRGNDPIDVAILTKPLFEKLVSTAKIVGGTTARLARVPIGLAVKKGAPKLDISSVESFKKTLLTAKFIAYGDTAMGDAGGIHVAQVVERLGLAGEMKPKTRFISPSPGQSGAQFLAGMFQRDEVEIAVAPISVLTETQGSDIVGLLPAELQAPDLIFFAGTPWTCQQPLEAKAFIDFLAGASAKSTYKAKGMEPG